MKTYLDGRVTLHGGDNRDVLRTFPDASIDSIVTDPPYALVSIVKRFGKAGAAAAKPEGMGGAYNRLGGGFMGKAWDTGEVAFAVEFWAECLRVLKPGGHVVAFSHTRTYHRMAVAIEDAGFEIRDQIGWTYGSGFPKSHDVSKSIDKAKGAKRQKIPVGAPVKRMIPGADQAVAGWEKNNGRTYQPGVEIPATPEAQQWEGWGTALKPAWEPICLARKPLIGSVAQNVLEHGTGAINIDGCRVEASAGDINEPTNGSMLGRISDDTWNNSKMRGTKFVARSGRFPANLIHDGSDEVVALFPSEAGAFAPVKGTEPTANGFSGAVAFGGMINRIAGSHHHGDSGSAARFFYTPKADADDRIGSDHPTVKPVDLMQYLVRLVTPKGGTVLDPFAGTGTTGEAAWREGMNAILIERDEAYLEDIARRMDLATKPSKRQAVAATKNKIDDLGPLFGGGK